VQNEKNVEGEKRWRGFAIRDDSLLVPQHGFQIRAIHICAKREKRGREKQRWRGFVIRDDFTLPLSLARI
jgi:hypothetical protein